MKKFFAAMLVLGILFTGCSSENPKEEPPQKFSTESSTPKPFKAYATGLPSQISQLPSIGTTRAEFDKYYTQRKVDGSRVEYENEQFIVYFFDADEEPSTNPNARAITMTFQPSPQNRFQADNINDYLPSDAYDVNEYYDVGEFKNDEMVVKDYIAGKSETLAQLYPAYEGHFSITKVYNRQTQEFLYAVFLNGWLYDF